MPRRNTTSNNLKDATVAAYRFWEVKCISKQLEFHRSMVRNIFHKCKTFKIKLCNAQTLQPTDCINVARKRPWNIVAQLMIINLQLNKAQDFGGNVLWTDETKVEMCGNNAQQHGWLKLNREHNIINTSHQLSNMMLEGWRFGLLLQAQDLRSLLPLNSPWNPVYTKVPEWL